MNLDEINEQKRLARVAENEIMASEPALKSKRMTEIREALGRIAYVTMGQTRAEQFVHVVEMMIEEKVKIRDGESE